MRLTRIFIITAFVLSGLAACKDKHKHEHNHDHAHDTTATGADAQAQADTVKKSIPREEHAQVGGVHVMIKYHAPAVRGRTIWGGLVPYREVWVTGAHNATSLEIDKPITIGGAAILPGKYALFTIPKQDRWTFIVNKNWNQHLADDYNQQDDVVRVDVTPEQMPTVQERLQYAVVSQGDAGGDIVIRWEKLKIAVPFKTH